MAASMSVCRTIVQKGNEYFMADRRDMFGGTKPRYSNSPYDAKAFKNDADARAKAKKIGGRVRLFDALNGEFI